MVCDLDFGGLDLGARLDRSAGWNFCVEHLSHIVGPPLWAPGRGVLVFCARVLEMSGFFSLDCTSLGTVRI